MLIKNELITFVNTRMNNFGDHNKNRILYYFGFVDGKRHTAEEAYYEYYNSKDLPSKALIANPRSGPASIFKQFKNELQKNPPKSLIQCAEILKNFNFINSEKFFQLLSSKGLVEDGFASIKGILDLLQEINLCGEYGIFSYDLVDLRHKNQKTYQKYQNTFLINYSIVGDLFNGLSEAENLPGDLGLARYTQLKSKLGKNLIYFSQISELIKANTENVVIEKDGETYYYIEKGKNTLIYKLGKIFSVVKKEVDIDELSTVLYQSFAQRGKVDNRKYPSPEIIQEFIRKYKFTKVKDGNVTFTGKKVPLTSFEKDIVEYFADHSKASWPSIKGYLNTKSIGNGGELKYGKDRIKNVFSSPILKRQGTQGKFVYSLIGSADSEAILEDIVQGGYQSIKSFGRDRTLSPKEFANTQRKLKETGEKGEEIVKSYLQLQKDQRLIENFIWDSSNNAISPHDFTVIEQNGSICFIDVKTTTGGFSNLLHISVNELMEMQESEKYIIYRVYDIGAQPKIRKSLNMKSTLISIIKTINELPFGVQVDSFSISPKNTTLIKFEDEFICVARQH